jgi:acetyl esterase/lipase
MTPVDPQARALLERWAARPSVPVERLTATAVRQEDLMVLDLQAAPDRLHAVDDIDVPGPAGAMTARVYRPGPGRLQTILYLHGGGFVIGPEGYPARVPSAPYLMLDATAGSPSYDEFASGYGFSREKAFGTSTSTCLPRSTGERSGCRRCLSVSSRDCPRH